MARPPAYSPLPRFASLISPEIRSCTRLDGLCSVLSEQKIGSSEPANDVGSWSPVTRSLFYVVSFSPGPSFTSHLT